MPPNSEQLEKRRAPSTVQFEITLDLSDAGSLITQAPQMNSVHATINALSAWISAVQPARILIPRGLDRGLTDRISSRPGPGCQRVIA